MGTLSEFDIIYIDKILLGTPIEDFRFFAECEKSDDGISFNGVTIHLYNSKKKEMTECKLENPEWGKMDIVPLDYPLHAKRRTYICDIEEMFNKYNNFIRK